MTPKRISFRFQDEIKMLRKALKESLAKGKWKKGRRKKVQVNKKEKKYVTSKRKS